MLYTKIIAVWVNALLSQRYDLVFTLDNQFVFICRVHRFLFSLSNLISGVNHSEAALIYTAPDRNKSVKATVYLSLPAI
jgi:hypothetical protein